MITITKKEKNVLDSLRKYSEDYEGGIPQEVLKNKLDIHEYQCTFMTTYRLDFFLLVS